MNNSGLNQKESLQGEMQVCYKHSSRTTLLRCNRCERPICLECAVQTPTGYRCKECIKEQEKKFNTSLPMDIVIAAVISFALAFIGNLIIKTFLFFPFLTTLFLGVALGNLTINAVRKACGHRRSPTLNNAMFFGAVVGSVFPLLGNAVDVLRNIFLGKFIALSAISPHIIWRILFAAVLCATIWSNLKGFKIKR